MKTIPLVGKLGCGLMALVDDEDYPVLAARSWRGYGHKESGLYAASGSTKTDSLVVMHRLLCPCAEGLTVDHINGNKLDNRRGNLRPATPKQQMWNRSPNRTMNGVKRVAPLKGVTFEPASNKNSPWRVRIVVDGRKLTVGWFAESEEAGRAYDAAALECFGQYARPNGAIAEVGANSNG